mgnify:CR=1 FL=1
MAFDRRFLDDLAARCDILDVVSRYVQLKKSGANYFGLCPFHNEKTPSFSVAPDKQIYHCFGCGAGGGAINFIMRMEGLPYPDAVRFLAAMYNVPVVEDNESQENRGRRERLLKLSVDAARFFYAQLHKPENARVKQYFLKRGLAGRTLNNFGLGYAPDSFHALLDAMRQKGYTEEELVAAGLAAKGRNGGCYDKFRNRVMFPIIDIRGNVIAFGGRVMDDSKPKYLNSPETIIFNKSRNLFGLNLARKTKKEYFILAEGYMDVIALHQAGFDSAVASLGTSLTEEQARMIARHTSKIIIAYDADEAGQKASQRAIDILKKTGLSVKVLKIPGAKDPDEYIKAHGAAAFGRLIDQSENHVEYQLQKIQAKYHIETDEEKVAFLREAAELIARLPSEIEREVYAGRVAKLCGISMDGMQIEVKNAFAKLRRREKNAEKREIRAPVSAVQPKKREMRYIDVRSARAEESLIALIFADGTLIDTICEKISPDDFSSELLGKIFRTAAEQYNDGRLLTVGGFEGVLDEDELSLLTEIITRPVNPGNRIKAVQDCIETILEQKEKRAGGGKDMLSRLSQTYREKQGLGGYDA